ncbi:MAG: sigma-70 family RNA polymerase sigma factor [Elusimicrobiaceae bacterium]|nr:sigma-70 family RNA polymerase sigma factor [Elusimicrobiaceae bacterium]
MPDNETDLIARARLGDNAAFETLALQYRDRLFGIAANVCAAMPSETEDVAQEAMLSAFTHIKTFKANSAFSTWLYRIAANKCFDRIRRAKIRGWTELPEDNQKGHPAGASANEDAIKNELSRAVNAALSALPLDYRLAVTLCDIEGLPNAEAAARLNITLAALKARLHRGRALLKEQLRNSA